MTTGLTYTTYVSQIATMAVVNSADPAFVTILPQMITYSENRLCRDLDFLFTSTSITGYALTEGNSGGINLGPLFYWAKEPR